MMTDDDKRNSDVKDEVKNDEVIDLDEARKQKEANEAADAEVADDTAADVSLEEAFKAVKDAFSELKEQLRPIKAQFNELLEAAKAGAENAREKLDLSKDDANVEKSVDELKDVVDASAERVEEAGKTLTPEMEDVKKTSEVINLAWERFKREGVEKKIDLKSVLRSEFESYADENLKEGDYTIDENGKKVVNVDAKFVQEHGAEVVPAILGGLAQSVMTSLFGGILGIQDAINKAEEAEKNGGVVDEASNSEDAKSDEAEAKSDDADDEAKEDVEVVSEPKYDVKFDFAKLIGDAIRSAKLSTSDGHAPSDEEDAQARDTAVKAAQVVEDVLNGKQPTEEELKEVAENKDVAPASLAPKEIEPLDDKHQRILDLAKEYDQVMKGDDDD